MPVSLPRSVVALEIISMRATCARILCSIVALGSVWCSSCDVVSAQAPAPAAAAPAAEKPPKEMTAGVKADGATKVDLAPLIARGTKRAQLWSAVAPMFNSDAAAPTQTQLDNLDTFAVWVLAELTWPASPSDTKTTPEYKRMYTKSRELLRAAGSEDSKAPLHDRVNAVLMANLPAMINDKEYSMTARYNAMLFLGQLDQVEGDPLKQRVGVPLAAAEKMLVAASQSSALPEVLRIGAWVGLARHADMAMAATNRKEIADEALKMLAATQPPQGISETGLQWIRKLSMQIVVGMLQRGGSEVKSPDYVKALVAILENDKQPLFLRRDAALTLGYYDPTTIVQGAGPEAVVKAMTNLTLEVMKAGTPRENPDAPADLTKGEDVLPTPTAATRNNFAQAVSYYLNCIAMGLGGRPDAKGKGLMKSAGASAAQVAKLLKPIDDLVNLMSNSRTGPEEMASKIASAHDELKSWAESNNLLAVPAAAAPTATSTPQPTQGASPAPTPAARQPSAGSLFPSPAGPVLGAAPRGN